MLSSGKKKYLFTICKLGIEGNEIRAKEIADFLQVKRPSVTKMLNALSEDHLIEKEYYGKVSLSEQGLRLANQLYTNFCLISTYFQETLQVSQENAEHDALICVCELSDESVNQFAALTLQQKCSPA